MLIAVEKAVESVLTLFLLGLVGFVLSKRGALSPETKVLLPKMIVLIVLPPFLFYHITTYFERESLLYLVYGAIVPAMGIGITFLISYVVAIIFKIDKKRRGVFSSGWGFSNTMFVGLPVNMTLFGEEAVPYVLLCYFGNTTIFWLFGSYAISLDGSQEKIRLFSMTTLKQIFTPPLQTFLAGLCVVLLNVQLPGFVMNSVRLLGNMTTPLALIYIGVTMAGVRFRELKVDRDVLLVMVGRFMVSPLVVLLVIQFIDLPPLMVKVFIIQSVLPVGTMVALMAGYYKADAEYASVLVSLSTLAAMVTIPLAMALISFI